MSDGISLGIVEVLGGTEKALKIRNDEGQMWVPKSVVHDDSEVYEGKAGESGELIVKDWWAEKHNLV